MNKKYKLTQDTIESPCGQTLYRIEALIDVIGAKVSKGDLGGYVQSESNLSQAGICWIYGDAKVFGTAKVSDRAFVYAEASVFGDARISDDAWVSGAAKVYDNARVSENAGVRDAAEVFNNAKVQGAALISEDARVHGDAFVGGHFNVRGNARILGDAYINSSGIIFDTARVANREECVFITNQRGGIILVPNAIFVDLTSSCMSWRSLEEFEDTYVQAAQDAGCRDSEIIFTRQVVRCVMNMFKKRVVLKDVELATIN